MTIEDEYMTLDEALVELVPLRISRRTLQRYAALGRLPGVIRIGREYRIPRSTVERAKQIGFPMIVKPKEDGADA